MNDSPKYYTQERAEIVQLVPKDIASIVDIGCGEGFFLRAIKKKTNAETWGIEIVTEIAQRAKKNVDRILTGNIEEVVFSLPEGYFDCITFNDVLEHLVHPEIILKSIGSKLKSDGIIIASIPNVRYFKNLFELLILKDWEYKEGGGILDSTHLRFFTKKSMVRLFENAGYTVIKQKGINKSTSFKFKILNVLSAGLLGDTKYLQFICIAKYRG